jgi:hypothetical protein
VFTSPFLQTRKVSEMDIMMLVCIQKKHGICVWEYGDRITIILLELILLLEIYRVYCMFVAFVYSTLEFEHEHEHVISSYYIYSLF